MSDYSFYHALAGGILIGLASLIASAASGKIPGISGIFGRLFRPVAGDTGWRLLFVVALILGAGLAMQLLDSAAVFRPVRGLGTIALAGLLVGIGTRIGGGCTSGHGVCGMGLGARDSIVATLVFMAAGIATVALLKVLPFAA
jgi:uncharacterized membrane protein YedE/YeeE